MKSNRSKPYLFFSVIGRVLIFLNSLSLILFFLYGVGNFQLFQDSTQLFILRNLEILSLVSGLMGGYYIAVLMILGMIKKKIYMIRLLLVIISIFYNFTLFMSLKFIFAWI